MTGAAPQTPATAPLGELGPTDVLRLRGWVESVALEQRCAELRYRPAAKSPFCLNTTSSMNIMVLDLAVLERSRSQACPIASAAEDTPARQAPTGPTTDGDVRVAP